MAKKRGNKIHRSGQKSKTTEQTNMDVNKAIRESNKMAG